MKKWILWLSLFALCSTAAMAQMKKVSGTVISADDQLPVPGATVRAKNHPKFGRLTDPNGHFEFEVPADAKTLLISFVGMKSVEVKAGLNLRVQLQAKARELDELVVTAMNVSRSKKTIGYATQEIKADELNRVRQTDVNNAIVGKVAGVRFVGGSGSKFDAGRIYLRGTGSFTSTTGSEPIYVVDGVITNANAVNMDDVASVNVLKGPAATALYGSQGGEGAIIITTKKAREGHTEITVSHTISWERPYTHLAMQKEYGGGYLGATAELPVFKYDPKMPERYKKLDGGRYYDYANDSSWGPRFDGKPYIPWYAWDPTDKRFGQMAPWTFGMDIEKLYRTGMNNTTNVSFSRGGRNFDARISFTNVKRKGVQYNSYAMRRYLSVQTNFRLNHRLRVGMDYKHSLRENHNGASEGYNAAGEFLQEYTMWGNTNVNLDDLRHDYMRPDGTDRTWNINSPFDLAPAFHHNPFALMERINRTASARWDILSGNIDWEPVEKLHIGGRFDANLRHELSEAKIPNNLSLTASYSQSQTTLANTRYQAYANYARNFLENRLSLTAALYAERMNREYKALNGFTRDGLFTDGFWNLAASEGKPGGSNTTIKSASNSIYGNVSLGWEDTYFLDANLRNDWASTLAPKANSYLYGGLSASVLLHHFIKTPFIDFWKLRASMAQVGSTLDPYQLHSVATVSRKYGNFTTMIQDRVRRNENIKPTISTSFEVGTEFRLWHNRIHADINFYNRDSKNQIVFRNVTPASGYDREVINAGLIRNRGLEITLGITPLRAKDLEWNLTFNWAKNVNTLVELIENDNHADTYQLYWMSFNRRISLHAIEGRPVGVIKGSAFERKDGKLLLRKLKNGMVAPKISPDDQELGVAQPDFTGGASTSFSFHGFLLGASLDYSVGGKMASVTELWSMGSGINARTAGNNDRGKPLRNPVKEGGGLHFKGVDKDGKPMDGYLDAQLYYQNLYPSAWGETVFDAGYVKLRELTLGYEFSHERLKSWGLGSIRKARLVFVAQNPWLIWSGVPNIDPSESSGSARNFLETAQAISTRSYGFTVSLSF